MAREIELVITVENEQALRELRKVDQALDQQERTAKKASTSLDGTTKATTATGVAAGTAATRTRELTTATTAAGAATVATTKATQAQSGAVLTNAQRIELLKQRTQEQARAAQALVSPTAAVSAGMGSMAVAAGTATAAVAAGLTVLGGAAVFLKAAGREYLDVSGAQDRVNRSAQGLKEAWRELLFEVGSQLAGRSDLAAPFRHLETALRSVTPLVVGLVGAMKQVADAAVELSGLGPLLRLGQWVFPDPRAGLPSGPRRTEDIALPNTGPDAGLSFTDEQLEAEMRQLWGQYHRNVAAAEKAAARVATTTAAVADAVDVEFQGSTLGPHRVTLAGLGSLSRADFSFAGWQPITSTAIPGVDSRTGAVGWSPSATTTTGTMGPAQAGLFSGFGGFLQQNLGPTILGAIQGGGNVASSLGGLLGGGLLSGGLGTAVTSGLTSALGSTIGGALGSVLPGVGTLLGGLAGGLVDKLFGPSQEAQVKKMRSEFLAGVSDLQALERQAELAGFSMSRLYDAKKVKDFEQAQKDLDQALRNWQAQLDTAMSGVRGLTDLTTGWAASLTDVTAATDESQASFERLGGFAFTMFANLLQHTGDFAAALEAIGPALDVLIAQQDEWGFSASTAVQNLLDIRKFNQAHPEIAQRISGLSTLITSLAKNGWLSVEMVQDFGREAVAAFHAATDAGATQEQALLQLQPALQVIWEQQQKNNLVLDEGTQGLLDMAVAGGVVGESFRSSSEQMLNVLRGIETAIQDLADALMGVGRVRVPEVVVPVRFEASNDIGDVTGAQHGGLVTATGVQYLAGGGRVLPFFRPRGTDTVPAMLTPGEGVLSRRGMAALGTLNRGGGFGGIAVTVHVDARESYYDSAASRDKLADKVGETILRKLQARDRLTARSA